MKQFIQDMIARYNDWRRLKQFEREFYEAFPQYNNGETIVMYAFALGIIVALIVVSIVKSL
jgi:cytochrome b subunit of formate dehydrogenase